MRPRSAACAVLDGRSVAVTASRDGTVRVWDLETSTAVGMMRAPGASHALLVDDTGRMAVALGSDMAIFTRR